MHERELLMEHDLVSTTLTLQRPETSENTRGIRNPYVSMVLLAMQRSHTECVVLD